MYALSSFKQQFYFEAHFTGKSEKSTVIRQLYQSQCKAIIDGGFEVSGFQIQCLIIGRWTILDNLCQNNCHLQMCSLLVHFQLTVSCRLCMSKEERGVSYWLLIRIITLLSSGIFSFMNNLLIFIQYILSSDGFI